MNNSPCLNQPLRSEAEARRDIAKARAAIAKATEEQP